jgi:enoyl-[acyl-carrier-protein] reductase (NADH)
VVERYQPAQLRLERPQASSILKESQGTLRRRVEACEVGRAAVMLVSDYASAVTGEMVHFDAGFHIAGMIFH